MSAAPMRNPRTTWAAGWWRPPTRARSAGIAPGDPVAHLRQVIVRPAHTDGQQGGAGADQIFPGRARVARDADGPLDLGGVATDVGAVLLEHPVLALQGRQVRPAVPDVGVLGGVAQRLALPAPTDQHRDVSGGCRVERRPAVLDPGQGRGQVGQPRARGAELVAVLEVVALEPAGTEDRKSVV